MNHSRTAEVAAAETDTVSVRLTLDVSYSLNGEAAKTMAANLRRMCERAIGEGLLTGASDAEVDEYAIAVAVRPAPLDEDTVADFLLERIEDGNLLAEEVPTRLARYGLMEPDAFVAEMQERMESSGFVANSEDEDNEE